MVVYAAIETLDGTVLMPRCRTVFVDYSEPAAALQSLQAGATLCVLGIPRIDFGAVWRAAETISEDPSATTYTLPYEMAVVGVYHANKMDYDDQETPAVTACFRNVTSRPCDFNGNFSVLPNGSAVASGTWSATYNGTPQGSGTWSASRPP
jgi:hypothetical protein